MCSSDLDDRGVERADVRAVLIQVYRLLRVLVEVVLHHFVLLEVFQGEEFLRQVVVNDLAVTFHDEDGQSRHPFAGG